MSTGDDNDFLTRLPEWWLDHSPGVTMKSVGKIAAGIILIEDEHFEPGEGFVKELSIFFDLDHYSFVNPRVWSPQPNGISEVRIGCIPGNALEPRLQSPESARLVAEKHLHAKHGNAIRWVEYTSEKIGS